MGNKEPVAIQAQFIMKLLHFADLHLGVERTGKIDPSTGLNARVVDYISSLDDLVQFAIDEDVDLVLFSGDAFHVHNPSPEYVTEFSKRMNRLRSQCQVVLLAGNHDIRRFGASTALNVYSIMDVEDLYVYTKMGLHTIETKSGMVQIIAMPYMTKHIISQDKLQGKTDAEISVMMHKVIKGKLSDMASKVNHDHPLIVAGHFTVEGSQWGTERGYVMQDHAFLSIDDLANIEADYIGLGHIHKHQVLCENPLIAYAGSMERVSFNEEKEAKGFMLVTIENGETAYEFIEISAREYKTIEVIYDSSTRELLKSLDTDVDGKIVRVIVHCNGDAGRISGDIIKHLLKYNAFSVDVSIKREIRTVTKVNSAYFNSSKEPIDLVSEYLKYIGVKGADKKELMSMAKEIMDESI